MDDDAKTPSGSRWEPTQDDRTTAEHPAQPPASAEAEPASYAPARAEGRRWIGRGGLLLASGALGVALVAGTGGYAIGHATGGGDDDRTGQVSRFGGDGSGDRDRDGDGRGGPGFAPPGQTQPDQTRPDDPGSENDSSSGSVT